MDCKFAEKVSMLIDGELPLGEAESVKTHLRDCADCRQLERDFLHFREQIKQSDPDSIWTTAVPRVQPIKVKVPFWKRQILLPVPVFVLFLSVLTAIGVWAVTSNFNWSKNNETVVDTAKKTPVENYPRQNTVNEISLSRFDKGGRTEIYRVQRTSPTQNEKSENLKH